MVQVEAAEIRVLFPIGVGRACRELPPPSDGRESEQFGGVEKLPIRRQLVRGQRDCLPSSEVLADLGE